MGALLDGADFAKGTRFAAGGGSADITVVRAWGNRWLNRIANLLFGTRYTDLCYGYNAFWAHVLPALELNAEGANRDEILRAVLAVAGGDAIFGPALARRVATFFSAPPPSPAGPLEGLTARETEILFPTPTPTPTQAPAGRARRRAGGRALRRPRPTCRG